MFKGENAFFFVLNGGIKTPYLTLRSAHPAIGVDPNERMFFHLQQRFVQYSLCCVAFQGSL